MAKQTLLVGEPMGLFIAQSTGHLEEVSGYSVAIAGAEFNVAVGMSRLGHKVSYLAKLGGDPFGKRVLKMMKENGISTDLITFSHDRSTGFMLKSMVENGDPEIYYYRKNSAASTLCGKDVENLDFSQYDTLHVTGITPALSDSTREATEILVQKARENHMLFSFDPNLRPQLWPNWETMIRYMNKMAGKCDIFLPGIKEAEILIGESDPVKVAETYLKMGAKTVIVKLGKQGAYYATESKSGFSPSFHEERIVDTVGAGDGFAAGVLTALQEKLPLEEAVRRGNAIGTIQVMCRGDNDGLPTIEELNSFIAGKPDWRKRMES